MATETNYTYKIVGYTPAPYKGGYQPIPAGPLGFAQTPYAQPTGLRGAELKAAINKPGAGSFGYGGSFRPSSAPSSAPASAPDPREALLKQLKEIPTESIRSTDSSAPTLKQALMQRGFSEAEVSRFSSDKGISTAQRVDPNVFKTSSFRAASGFSTDPSSLRTLGRDLSSEQKSLESRVKGLESSRAELEKAIAEGRNPAASISGYNERVEAFQKASSDYNRSISRYEDMVNISELEAGRAATFSISDKPSSLPTKSRLSPAQVHHMLNTPPRVSSASVVMPDPGRQFGLQAHEEQRLIERFNKQRTDIEGAKAIKPYEEAYSSVVRTIPSVEGSISSVVEAISSPAVEPVVSFTSGYFEASKKGIAEVGKRIGDVPVSTVSSDVSGIEEFLSGTSKTRPFREVLREGGIKPEESDLLLTPEELEKKSFFEIAQRVPKKIEKAIGDVGEMSFKGYYKAGQFIGGIEFLKEVGPSKRGDPPVVALTTIGKELRALGVRPIWTEEQSGRAGRLAVEVGSVALPGNIGLARRAVGAFAAETPEEAVFYLGTGAFFGAAGKGIQKLSKTAPTIASAVGVGFVGMGAGFGFAGGYSTAKAFAELSNEEYERYVSRTSSMLSGIAIGGQATTQAIDLGAAKLRSTALKRSFETESIRILGKPQYEFVSEKQVKMSGLTNITRRSVFKKEFSGSDISSKIQQKVLKRFLPEKFVSKEVPFEFDVSIKSHDVFLLGKGGARTRFVTDVYGKKVAVFESFYKKFYGEKAFAKEPVFKYLPSKTRIVYEEGGPGIVSTKLQDFLKVKEIAVSGKIGKQPVKFDFYQAPRAGEVKYFEPGFETSKSFSRTMGYKGVSRTRSVFDAEKFFAKELDFFGLVRSGKARFVSGERVSVIKPFTAEVFKSPTPSYKPLTFTGRGTGSKTSTVTAITGEKPLGFFGKKMLSAQVSLKKAGVIGKVDPEFGAQSIISKAAGSVMAPIVRTTKAVTSYFPITLLSKPVSRTETDLPAKDFFIPGSAAALGKGKISGLVRSSQADFPADLEGVFYSFPFAKAPVKEPFLSNSIGRQVSDFKKGINAPMVSGLKIKSILKEDVGKREESRSLFSLRPAFGMGLRELSRQGFVNRQTNLQKQFSIQIPIQDILTIQTQQPRQIQTPIQAISQYQKPIHIQREFPPIPIIVPFDFTFPKPEIIIPPPSFVFFQKMELKNGRKQKKLSNKGFIPQVKRFGKWVNVLSSPVERPVATAFGAKEAIGTPARSFRVKEVMSAPIKMASPKLPFGWKQQFRKSKSNLGVLVEKSKYAIDTSGEKRGITFKGLEALTKMPKKKKGSKPFAVKGFKSLNTPVRGVGSIFKKLKGVKKR